MKFSTAALAGVRSGSTNQLLPGGGVTDPGINATVVAVDVSCQNPKASYFLQDSMAASSCFFEGVFVNPGASAVDLLVGGSVGLNFGAEQSFGLPVSFITKPGTMVDNILSPISRIAALGVQDRSEANIVGAIWLQAASQNYVTGALKTFQFDKNIQACFRSVPLAFCDACPDNNNGNTFTRVYYGAFYNTARTGFSINIPGMGDDLGGLRIKFEYGSIESRAYADCNGVNPVVDGFVQ